MAGQVLGHGLGLAAAPLGQRGVVDAQAVALPLGFAVADQQDLHARRAIRVARRAPDARPARVGSGRGRRRWRASQQAAVPVASQVGRLDRHDHEVAGAGRDVAAASGAEVGLGRLVGLDAADLDLERRQRRSRTRTSPVGRGSADDRPDHQAQADDQRRADQDVVERGAAVLAVRIESHRRQYRRGRPHPGSRRSGVRPRPDVASAASRMPRP